MTNYYTSCSVIFRKFWLILSHRYPMQNILAIYNFKQLSYQCVTLLRWSQFLSVNKYYASFTISCIWKHPLSELCMTQNRSAFCVICHCHCNHNQWLPHSIFFFATEYPCTKSDLCTTQGSQVINMLPCCHGNYFWIATFIIWHFLHQWLPIEQVLICTT